MLAVHQLISGTNLRLTLRVNIWYLCLALFSYLSAESPQARPFFPILCVTLALYTLIRPSYKKSQIFFILRFPVYLICFALVSYFGLIPIGLFAISITMVYEIVYTHLRKKAASLSQESQQSIQKEDQQPTEQREELPTSSWPNWQVPGQQSQPLLPEFNESHGAYIQNLPPTNT
jgi:hypothetical protein